jgi:hypothetical protein
MSFAPVPVTLRDMFYHDPFFSSAWPEFDRLHGQLMNESRNLWALCDQHDAQGQCQSPKAESPKIKMDGDASPEHDSEMLIFFPKRWMLPR